MKGWGIFMKKGVKTGIAVVACVAVVAQLGGCSHLTTARSTENTEEVMHDGFEEGTGVTAYTPENSSPATFSENNGTSTEDVSDMEALDSDWQDTMADWDDTIYTTEDGWKYKKGMEGLVLIDYSGTESDLAIPEQIDDNYVAAIAEQTFAKKKNGKVSGKNTTLKTVIIPQSITIIGQQAFYNCTALESVTIQEPPEGQAGIQYIGEQAFYNCKALKNINLPQNLMEIGAYAFQNCSSLEAIYIPKWVSKLGDENSCVFSGNTNLKTILLGNKDTLYKNTDYADCPKLSVYISSGKNKAQFAHTTQTKKAVVVPDTIAVSGKTYTVTKIAAKAFCKDEVHTSVTLGKNIKAIGKQAFYNCKKIKKLTIKTTKLTTSTVGSKAFGKLPVSLTIKVPKGKLSSYKKILRTQGLDKKIVIQ